MSEEFYLYTTDKKVEMFSSEDEVNSKLVALLGEKFEKYRERFLQASNFQLETNFPLYLQIELHQICNLKCPMCSIGAPKANEKYITDEKMSWETYEKIILEGEISPWINGSKAIYSICSRPWIYRHNDEY